MVVAWIKMVVAKRRSDRWISNMFTVHSQLIGLADEWEKARTQTLRLLSTALPGSTIYHLGKAEGRVGLVKTENEVLVCQSKVPNVY